MTQSANAVHLRVDSIRNKTDSMSPAGFRLVAKGVSCRSESVNGTRGVDSQKAIPTIHKLDFPDLFSFPSVTAA